LMLACGTNRHPHCCHSGKSKYFSQLEPLCWPERLPWGMERHQDGAAVCPSGWGASGCWCGEAVSQLRHKYDTAPKKKGLGLRP